LLFGFSLRPRPEALLSSVTRLEADVSLRESLILDLQQASAQQQAALQELKVR
jgi:hypothetical protein